MNKDEQQEIPKYIKKKQSSVSKVKKKSSHKHNYVECIFEYTIGNDKDLCCSRGWYCSNCGKIKNNKHLWESELIPGSKNHYKVLTVEELKQKYPHLKVIHLDDYFYQKYISLTKEGEEQE